jgi:hypothetical protein
LHGAAQDHALVLEGERVQKVDETLDFVANLLSLAGKEVTYEWVSSDGCAGDHEAVTGMAHAQFGRDCWLQCPGLSYNSHF